MASIAKSVVKSGKCKALAAICATSRGGSRQATLARNHMKRIVSLTVCSLHSTTNSADLKMAQPFSLALPKGGSRWGGSWVDAESVQRLCR